ncbi:hypothetical protein KI387_027574, partial [Taxus chinensis]
QNLSFRDGFLYRFLVVGALYAFTAVQECPIGKGLFSSTLEKPEKQVEQDVTREQGKHMFHKVVTGSGPENIKAESCTHINSNERLLKRDLQNSDLFVDNGVHLTEILQELARMTLRDICHNAMNEQEKGSMIWEAANTFLYKGKKYLEQYADRAITFFWSPHQSGAYELWQS